MKQFSQKQFGMKEFVQKQFKSNQIIPPSTKTGNGGVYIEPIPFLLINDDEEILSILVSIITEL